MVYSFYFASIAFSIAGWLMGILISRWDFVDFCLFFREVFMFFGEVIKSRFFMVRISLWFIRVLAVILLIYFCCKMFILINQYLIFFKHFFVVFLFLFHWLAILYFFLNLHNTIMSLLQKIDQIDFSVLPNI